MTEFGKWPKSVGGRYFLYPDSNGLLYTDADKTEKANRHEVEANLPDVFILFGTGSFAVPFVIKTHTTANGDDELYVWIPSTTEGVTTYVATKYTVNETTN